MKYSIKSCFVGILIGIILSITLITTPLIAASGMASLDVVLNNVNLMLDGQKIGSEGSDYILSNGDSVPYSILYKGTTYLPVRKLSELLDKDVGYIGESRTVVLGAMPETTAPGWYQSSKKLNLMMYDYSIFGELMSDGNLFDKYTAVGNEGSYTITHSRRVTGDSSPRYWGTSLVEFSSAPDILLPNTNYSMTLSHQIVEGDWSIDDVSITFSSAEAIGYGGSGDILFVDSTNQGYYYNKSGTLTTNRVIPTGSTGDTMYIKVALGHGYGYTYTYVWKD